VDSPLSTYLTALDRGDMQAAAAAFTEDAVYFRPAAADAGFEIVHGRRAIHALFDRRGKQPFTHEIRTFVVDGARCLAEGVVVGDSVAKVFVASATVEDDGLLSRYLGVARSVSSEELDDVERSRR
jgi:ketosteroid isomerase-like protein